MLLTIENHNYETINIHAAPMLARILPKGALPNDAPIHP